MNHTSRSLQERPSGSRKLLGGIGLLVFLGAFFVMPLCAALAICSMPCCEHGDQSQRSMPFPPRLRSLHPRRHGTPKDFSTIRMPPSTS
jgi:hypothetical protein